MRRQPKSCSLARRKRQRHEVDSSSDGDGGRFRGSILDTSPPRLHTKRPSNESALLDDPSPRPRTRARSRSRSVARARINSYSPGGSSSMNSTLVDINDENVLNRKHTDKRRRILDLKEEDARNSAGEDSDTDACAATSLLMLAQSPPHRRISPSSLNLMIGKNQQTVTAHHQDPHSPTAGGFLQPPLFLVNNTHNALPGNYGDKTDFSSMRLRRARPRRAVRRLVDAGYESNEEPEPVAAHSLLPPELWMKIFIAVVPFNTAVFRLSGVCRLWREIFHSEALSMRLWRHIFGEALPIPLTGTPILREVAVEKTSFRLTGAVTSNGRTLAVGGSRMSASNSAAMSTSTSLSSALLNSSQSSSTTRHSSNGRGGRRRSRPKPFGIEERRAMLLNAYPAGVRLKSSPLYRNLNSEQEREKSSAAAYHQINDGSPFAGGQFVPVQLYRAAVRHFREKDSKGLMPESLLYEKARSSRSPLHVRKSGSNSSRGETSPFEFRRSTRSSSRSSSASSPLPVPESGLSEEEKMDVDTYVPMEEEEEKDCSLAHTPAQRLLRRVLDCDHCPTVLKEAVDNAKKPFQRRERIRGDHFSQLSPLSSALSTSSLFEGFPDQFLSDNDEYAVADPVPVALCLRLHLLTLEDMQRDDNVGDLVGWAAFHGHLRLMAMNCVRAPDKYRHTLETRNYQVRYDDGEVRKAYVVSLFTLADLETTACVMTKGMHGNLMVLHLAAMELRALANFASSHKHVWQGCPRIARALLAAGCAPTRGNSQLTPLHWCCWRDTVPAQRFAVACMLLHAGADPNAKGPDGVTPICMAARNGLLTLCQLLLDHGVDVNSQCSQEGTALHVALGMFVLFRSDEKTGDMRRLVRMLLRRGADVQVRNSDGITPLGLVDILEDEVKLLVRGVAQHGIAYLDEADD